MAYVNHPYPGPNFTVVVAGTIVAGKSGTATRGADIPVTRCILSCGNDSTSPAFIVSAATDSVDMGCPLHSNIPVEIGVDNLNRIYIAGDATTTVVQYYGER